MRLSTQTSLTIYHAIFTSSLWRFGNELLGLPPTSFANPILLAAAFDDRMIGGIGDVVRTEERVFANVGKAGWIFGLFLPSC